MSKKRALSLLILLALVAILLAGCAPVRDAEGNVSAPTWIAWLAAPLAAVIQALYEKVLTPLGLDSYGLAIILVTILIRLLLYPLTRKQMESMKKMQAVQPKMKELQEKYGKDRNKLAEKQMELYREEGVNPAGGCLPLLIQMPILIAFYYALLMLGPKLDQPFLWIPSLAFPPYFGGMSWLTPVTLQHLLSPDVWPYLILPVVYVVSQIIMQRMSQSANPSQLPGSTNTMMMMMPLMFGYITLIVPSGLSVYWVTSNILQIIQQGLTTGWTGLWPLRAPAAAGVTKAGAKSGATAAAVSEPASGSAAAADEMSAGRRRKMRKKKK
ncbi:MAG: membrane protein insertase YidC [Anaerolinea sp.]|nr:membrane protein insertase YidC [Anaerolinea sp.]